jgi:hypothetical protein
LRNKWINDIKILPQQLIDTCENLNDAQLDTPYRPEGWTLRQVVHHVADSHVNAYIRYKLACTELNPTIKPYLEAKWAELNDAKKEDIQISLDILQSIHRRWVIHLHNMSEADWKRTFFHPESLKTFVLEKNLGLYSWHGRHHLAHITNTKERMGW